MSRMASYGNVSWSWEGKGENRRESPQSAFADHFTSWGERAHALLRKDSWQMKQVQTDKHKDSRVGGGAQSEQPTGRPKLLRVLLLGLCLLWFVRQAKIKNLGLAIQQII
ncbi:hypothetical protein B0H63DRAFT_450739 [Podospora didyma]|uniref:Uncharacterized protein n=1 Tax=Podospora didyma TaxID=330526 RepID=A0AAE0TVW1_9PEZI|nr:hypothetical protein B0H63DRAFT_450739 [Podospora didyma]